MGGDYNHLLILFEMEKCGSKPPRSFKFNSHGWRRKIFTKLIMDKLILYDGNLKENISL